MVEGNDPALDAQLAQVRLFPSTEVLDYIRTQGANPASAPAAPTP
jgi:nickel transport protein